MAYDEKLGDRIREIIAETQQNVEEKKMFGGLCFMVNDKMCLGVMKEKLMLRINPATYDEMMEEEGCHPMNFTGRSMKGIVLVDPNAIRTKKQLQYWINIALDYNKIAKASKKKKR